MIGLAYDWKVRAEEAESKLRIMTAARDLAVKCRKKETARAEKAEADAKYWSDFADFQIRKCADILERAEKAEAERNWLLDCGIDYDALDCEIDECPHGEEPEEGCIGCQREQLRTRMEREAAKKGSERV